MATAPKIEMEIRRPGKFARIAHAALLLSASFLLLVLSVALIRLFPPVRTGVVKFDALMDESARTVIDAKALVKQASATEGEQAAYLREWDGKVSVTFDRTNAAIASLQNATDRLSADEDRLTGAAVGTLNATTATVQSMKGDTAALQTAATHLDQLIADPDVRSSIHSTSVLAEQAAGIASDTHKVTTHFEREIDAPKKSVWGKIGVAWKIAWQGAMLIK